MRWVVLIATLTASGCVQRVPARFESAAELPDDERRPDGVAVDLVSDPPPWADQADTGEHVTTLRAPLGLDIAREAVRAFFAAIVREDATALSDLVGPRAMVFDTRTSGNSRTQSLVPMWRVRFGKHDYGQLASRVVFQESEVMSYRADELEAVPLEVQHLVRDETVEPTVVVLRVPIQTTTIENERLFGDELYFWLRRRDDAFEIFQVAEAIPF